MKYNAMGKKHQNFANFMVLMILALVQIFSANDAGLSTYWKVGGLDPIIRQRK